jgi:hypothetical protein
MSKPYIQNHKTLNPKILKPIKFKGKEKKKNKSFTPTNLLQHFGFVFNFVCKVFSQGSQKAL